jgi:cytochrome c oxidase subunit 2
VFRADGAGKHVQVRRVTWGVACGALVLATAGCGDRQSTLHPESHAARTIATLWWVMFVGASIVVGVVTLLVLIALLKGRGRLDRVDRSESPGARTAVLVSGAVVPAVVLFALFVYMLTTLDATAEPRPKDSRFTIDVIGRQWFWDVRYPQQGIRTANELHVPVGVPVRVQARTADVIHSFWVPELNRKIDMIPGYDNSVLIRAGRAGVYRGQCAEFCGLQHANMAFYVVAESRAKFARWVAREQRRPSTTAPGARVFSTVGCGGCHRIAGVSDGTIGPDLSHVGSRIALAAGTIPNERGRLGGWILDPQHIKPGNKMPALPISGRRLQQLLDYLESLK